MNLRHSRLPWDFVKLGSLAEFRNGINYSKANFGKGIKVINVKDFQDRLYAEYDDLDEVNPTGIVNPGSILENNDILFVRSNGNRELIGRSLIIGNPPVPVMHSAFTIRARLGSTDTLPNFFLYLFRPLSTRDALRAHGSGTNISNLNQQILANLMVPLPPPADQERIASILSAYDDLIENNMRRIAILEEMARALYQEWFVHFCFPGHERVPLVDCPLGPIPEGWEVANFTELADVLSGGTPKKSEPDFWGGPDTFLHAKGCASERICPCNRSEYHRVRTSALQ